MVSLPPARLMVLRSVDPATVSATLPPVEAWAEAWAEVS